MRPMLLGLLLGISGPILFLLLRNRLRSEGAQDQSPSGATVKAERSSREPGHTMRAEPDNLSHLTAAELYRRAQAAGIAGRSGMSKAQLIAALRAINHM
jgi:hypothetical protein